VIDASSFLHVTKRSLPHITCHLRRQAHTIIVAEAGHPLELKNVVNRSAANGSKVAVVVPDLIRQYRCVVVRVLF
jgi:hypothetical protein